jgi:CYTH domain-containing protein
MNIERERKFQVLFRPPNLPEGRIMTTGYFTENGVAVRASYSNKGVARVCFKGPGTEERAEFEYRIPLEDGVRLVELAPTRLIKIRYDMDGWEIDFFPFIGSGFWMAEWEEHDGKARFPDVKPDWLGSEVTEDLRFTNQALAWQHGKRERE